MNISRQLVERFLTNQASKEEANFLYQYFIEHPEALEEYIGATDWQQFNAAGRLDSQADKGIWQEIKRQTGTGPTIRKMRLIRMTAAAAVLLFAVSGTWIFINKRSGKQPVQIVKTDVAAVMPRSIVNTGSQQQQVSLEDGTALILMPGSELKYQLPFADNERLFTLTGKAFFDVAHDTKRPFRVKSGGLTTTALGTSFWVEAMKDSNHVQVQLISGKVVINKEHFDAVYLSPGQQLVYNITTEQSSVYAISSDNNLKHNTVNKENNKQANEHTLLFNQTPLNKVFRQLQQEYNISIVYEEDQLNRMTFSGSYTAADDVEDILHTIALINDLKLEKTPVGFTITR